MAVQDLAEGMSSREAVVEELEELPTDVGLDTLAERWIEPQDVAAVPPPPCRWAAGWAEDELMVVASPLEGVLEGSLGRIEHGLAGGEGGEAPLDLQGDVLEDVGGVVGLPVHVVDDLLRLDPRPVGALLEVQGHIQEVCDLEVGFDL